MQFRARLILAALAVTIAACDADDPEPRGADGSGGEAGGPGSPASSNSSGGSSDASVEPTCGDGACGSGEACDTCEQDCGKCAGWCGQDALCNPFDANTCPDGYPVCQPAVDYYHGDTPELDLDCWNISFIDAENQQVNEPCGDIDFGSSATCAVGLICIDPTPFDKIEAGDPPSVYDARCHKACCDDADCDPGGQCKKLDLPSSGSLGYCP